MCDEESNGVSVGLVVPGYEAGGGVPAVADFLMTALERIGGFRLRVVAPAISWNDPLNACLSRPRDWFRGPRAATATAGGRAITRVGARWAEAEFMRYRPRAVLGRAVAGSRLVQVVCGSAVSAYALHRIRVPLFIQVATTLRVEREQGRRPGPGGLFRRTMTRLCEPMERAALRRADGVFVENRWMFDRLTALLPPERVHFAPPGIDTDFFRPDPAVARDRLLFVGRLGDPRKNVRLLLEAYRQVRAQHPGAPVLALAGAPALADDDARFLAASGLAPYVEIHYAPDRQALAALYRRCRIFLLGSHEEGFGLVLVEAMAGGAPVVSTDCGGPRGIVEEGANGFLVPVNAAGALAARVVELLAAPERCAAMGERARRDAVARFDLAVCGRRFADVYRRALAAGESGR